MNKNSLKNEYKKTIEYIYHIFKQSFPEAKYQQRHSALGIGEDGKHLMCSFWFSAGHLYIKFKNKSPFIYNNKIDITQDIEDTITLFANNEYKLKHKPNTTSKRRKGNTYNSKKSTLSAYDLITVQCKYEESLAALGSIYDDVNFDSCSKRLRNALIKNNIICISNLKSIEVNKLLKFENFGTKCFYELCEFLQSIKEKTPETYAEENNLYNQKVKMLDYIQSIKVEKINLNITEQLSEYSKFEGAYADLYIQWVDYFVKTAKLKLTPREQCVFFLRVGINETQKTLKEIADKYSVTRECIRRIESKAKRKFKAFKTNTLESIQNEYEKCKLIEYFYTIPIEGFLAYLYFNIGAYQMLYILHDIIFKDKLKLEDVKQAFSKYAKDINKQRLQKIKQDEFKDKQEKFNRRIYDLISFSRKRKISDEDFARLKTERDVDMSRLLLQSIVVDNKSFQCESNLEKTILERFLRYDTFKDIKTQSLKIPYKNNYYYPDFQCLTHDNIFVIIEIKPLLHMCERHNIEKFKVLKAYCERYGFGYMIIDDRYNEFFHVYDNNKEFSRLILDKLNTENKIDYSVYKKIYKTTNATLKNLLSLIKDSDISFSLPFLLTK